MANPAITLAWRTGLPAFVIWRENLLGAAARFGVTRIPIRYPFLFTISITGPGPTRAIALPAAASAFAGGGRLERTAAATTAAEMSRVSPDTRRRSSKV